MLTTLYRKIVPLSFRKFVYDLFLENILYFFRNFNILFNGKKAYYFSRLLPETELNKAYRFIGKHGITSYPYEYMLEYQRKDIQVLFDEQNGLPYVVHNGHKLYFRKATDIETIKSDYRALITEQDPRSAHRYVRSYSELGNKILLDIGSAEGIFSLDTIDFTKHVYLFECEPEWLLPLQATFSPWKHKVTIVQKYVGNRTDETHVALDDFLCGNTDGNLFLKMDIEGAEMQALQGAMNTLRHGSDIQLAVCTYHRPGDPETIAALMTSLGFQNEFTDGLMFWGKKFSKGVLRSKK